MNRLRLATLIQSSLAKVIPLTLHDRMKRTVSILLIGYLVRIIVMPLFGSVDAATTIWVSTVLADQGKLALSQDPPPIFYLHAFFLNLFRPFYPQNILDLERSNLGFTPPGLFLGILLSEPGIAVVLTLLKIPYLIADFGTAMVLARFPKTTDQAISVLKLWVFNPVVIYVSYFIGQFDIVPVFFVVLAFYWLRQNRRMGATVALGVSMAFKFFAVFLLPFFLVMFLKHSQGRRESMRMVATVVAAIVAPFLLWLTIYAFQTAYYESANLALSGGIVNGFFGTVIYNLGRPTNPLAQGLLKFIDYSVKFPIVPFFPDTIIVVPAVLATALLALAHRPKIDFQRFWNFTLAVFLLFYAFSLFHAQWFLWIQPFLVVAVVYNRSRFLPSVILLTATFFVYIWYWDPLLTTALLVPTLPTAYHWSGPLQWLDSIGLSGASLVSLARSAFSGFCLYTAYLAFRQEETSEPTSKAC